MASARSPHDLKLHDSIVEEVLALKLLRREQSHSLPFRRELHGAAAGVVAQMNIFRGQQVDKLSQLERIHRVCWLAIMLFTTPAMMVRIAPPAPPRSDFRRLIES
jgi:hypothetical protein